MKRAFHQLKDQPLGIRPLFVHRDDQVRGLTHLLSLALRVLTLFEVLVRRGTYAWMPPLPAIPGIEMSGVVAEIGAGVTSLRAGQPVYVVAEIGINHNGDVALTSELVEAAAEAGADAIKFQTHFPEHEMLKKLAGNWDSNKGVK